MSAVKKHKIKLREVNRHLVCRLCRGYYVDATTIAECLHSFCRSCIIEYLEKNSFCPICEVQIHATKPYLSLRQDKALQDVVYKLVPGLYHNEMQRRRDFYSKHPEQIPATAPEQCGIEDRIIFSPDEIISLSLEKLDRIVRQGKILEAHDKTNIESIREEYVFESISSQSSEAGSDSQSDGSIVLLHQLVLKKLKNRPEKNSRRRGGNDDEVSPRPKRYLRCPAAVAVSHLKKFIRMKYDLCERSKVDIIHKRVSLPDHYTLMDIAYIYTWKRNGPMRIFYYCDDPKLERMKVLEQDARTEVKDPVVVKDEKVNDKMETFSEKLEKSCRVTTAVPSPPIEDTKPEAKAQEVKPSELVPNGNACNGTDYRNGTDPRSRVQEKDSVSPPKADVTKEKDNAEATATAEPKRESITNGSTDAKAEVLPKTSLNKVNTESVPSQKDDEKSTEKVNGTEATGNVPKKEEKLKKTIASLLKSYRKENSSGGDKAEAKKGDGDSIPQANPTARDEAADKKESDDSVEAKPEAKASEYDFESNSPPGKIIPLREFTKSEQCKNRKPHGENGRMSLQDFRKVVKENDKPDPTSKPSKIRQVPSLKRIDENRKSPVQKPNGKLDDKLAKSPTNGNSHADGEDSSKKENRVETGKALKKDSPPPPITIANKGGEYTIKQLDENKKPEAKETGRNAVKRSSRSPEATEPSAKKSKMDEIKSDSCGAMDLTKSDAGTKLAEAYDSGKKNDENMVEALISAAQKQNLEPLLRVPQFLKNPGSAPLASPIGKNISPSDISQALQFFKDLRSDIRVLEAKNQLTAHAEQFPSKLNPFHLYQQQMELIKRLKHQMMTGEYQTPSKVPKPSPPSEKQKKSSPTSDKPKSDSSPGSEDSRTKSPADRSPVHAQGARDEAELQNRMKHLKSLPALLQFYNRPPFLYCPGTSPGKPNQSKSKSPSLSPNVQKTGRGQGSNHPLSMTAPGSSLFNNQSYSPVLNTGLTSEMTFHQMFQNYLSQQEKMNQIKPPLPSGRPRHTPPGGSPSGSDLFYGGGGEKTNRSPPKQKI